jgi:hypothetical protein
MNDGSVDFATPSQIINEMHFERNKMLKSITKSTKDFYVCTLQVFLFN